MSNKHLTFIWWLLFDQEENLKLLKTLKIYKNYLKHNNMLTTGSYVLKGIYFRFFIKKLFSESGPKYLGALTWKHPYLTTTENKQLLQEKDPLNKSWIKKKCCRHHFEIYMITNMFRFRFFCNKIHGICFCYLPRNKPAAQAAGTDPSRCSFTNRQNPHIQQNCRNVWSSDAIVMPNEIDNLLKFTHIVYSMTLSTTSNH